MQYEKGLLFEESFVKELKEKNLISAYHYITGEPFGNETQGTFFLYRHKDKKYHIDYCFLNSNYLVDFQILNNEKWLQYSDHMPIITVIDAK